MSPSPPRSILPLPSAEERAHSEAVSALIRAELSAAGGWLSFERFMELALYAPGLGYYSAGSAKLGAAGDFVTAPESSDLFSRCLARQCAQVLQVTGGEILELGAGTGRMAAAVLTELEALGALPERYAILEVSAELAARQRERLAALPAPLRERVVWLERLPERPLHGVIVANEVADALPCRRFILTADGPGELGVELADADPLHDFRDALRVPDTHLARACEEIVTAVPEELPEGYSSEVCLRLAPWINSLAACLARGALLICDYGLPRRHYYHPQRLSGTLRCHYRHRAHDDPYLKPGVQDITAWVDFTALAEAAPESRLTVAGFTTQAAFLLGTGIEQLVAAAATDLERARLAGEARRLIMPEEMGEAFKVMALTRGCDMTLAGFAISDLRHLL
jgi:SAM-dependent MidA family methyltransferase